MNRLGQLPSLGTSGSINATPADFLLANYVSGMQINGRMSTVRRFFCLFVTFDLLFTCLFWIICILINGENLVKALEEEVEHYSIKTSIFDIVMTAAIRFTVLLLFYALLHINHWWLVALTTAGSCAFLIAKTLLYTWQTENSRPFEVMLVLISFLIAWAEAWFIDFRVLPQEARARSILEAAAGSSEHMENDPLLPQLERVRDYLSHYTETVGDFYSPMESPLGSDDDDDGFTRTDYRKLSPEEKQMQASGYDALQKAWETVNSPGWKVEKETSHGDTVSSKVGPKGSKIYKLVGMVEVEPKTLFNEMLFNFENIPTWNKAITLGRVVQTIDSCTDVVYQVAAEGPGGVVSARDFVNVRHWKKIGDCWVSANVSVVHKDEPPQKSIVRGENGPGCWVFSPVAGAPKKCSFQWLLDTDLKGWIPQYVIDQALTFAMTDFLQCLRNYAPHISASKCERYNAR